MTKTVTRSATRVCPYFRLPRFGRLEPSGNSPGLPACTALAPPHDLDHETAARLCRSGAYPRCSWFRTAQPAAIATRRYTSEPPLGKKLLTSALWVIGIPTGITLLILIAAWITENVWAPTQQIIVHLTGSPWA